MRVDREPRVITSRPRESSAPSFSSVTELLPQRRDIRSAATRFSVGTTTFACSGPGKRHQIDPPSPLASIVPSASTGAIARAVRSHPVSTRLEHRQGTSRRSRRRRTTVPSRVSLTIVPATKTLAASAFVAARWLGGCGALRFMAAGYLEYRMLFSMTARKIDRLYERRILPRAEEEQFTYEMVRFHLEDLNALAERTAAQPKRQRDSARSVARVAAIVQAASWNRTGFLGAIRRFVREGRAEAVDAFGPTLLLLALEPEQPP